MHSEQLRSLDRAHLSTFVGTSRAHESTQVNTILLSSLAITFARRHVDEAVRQLSWPDRPCQTTYTAAHDAHVVWHFDRHYDQIRVRTNCL